MTKDYVLILDRSWLFQNICRAILSKKLISECAMHVDDIDIFCSSQMPVALVVGESSYDGEKWAKMLVRNPDIKRIKKIFISEKVNAPDGFSLLMRPFRSEELLSKLCDNLDIKRAVLKKDAGKTAGSSSNRRIFGRNAVRTPVYLDDEFGVHLLELEMRDLSLGGMFICGNIPVKIGSMMFVSFELGGKDISATCQVVRMESDGMGVRFMGLSEDAKKALEGRFANVS